MREHTQLLLRGDSAILEYHQKKREADNQAAQTHAVKEGKDPALRPALRRALSRGENDEKRAEFFQADLNGRMNYYRNHARAEMFERFAQHFLPASEMKISDGKTYADLHGPNYGGQAIDFSTTHLLRKEEKVNEGVYLNAYTKALEELIAIEKSRGEFINEVQKSQAYTQLPDQKAKDGHMGLRLMEVYTIDTKRFPDSLGVNRYFPSLEEMRSLVEKEKERNAKQAAPQQAPADNHALRGDGDGTLARIGKELQAVGFKYTGSGAAASIPSVPQAPGERRR
jgi:hypothetical protein